MLSWKNAVLEDLEAGVVAVEARGGVCPAMSNGALLVRNCGRRSDDPA
jgi:hypothetical protein